MDNVLWERDLKKLSVREQILKLRGKETVLINQALNASNAVKEQELLAAAQRVKFRYKDLKLQQEEKKKIDAAAAKKKTNEITSRTFAGRDRKSVV